MSNSPQTPAAATLDLASLLATAAARKAEEVTPSRSRKLAYGIFETSCGHVIAVDYTAQGKVRMDSWGLYRRTADGKVTRLATYRRKVDALNALDAQRAERQAAAAAAEAAAAEAK